MGCTGLVTISDVSVDICTRSAALLGTFAAISASLVASTSVAGCGGVPGWRSTRTEVLPGRIVRRVSPATTSTSRGGKTVRVVATAGSTTVCEAGVSVARAASLSVLSRALCLNFAARAGLATIAGSDDGAAMAAGELSNNGSDSASWVSGNQKSRSCQSTMPRARRRRQSDPSISPRCLGSSVPFFRGSAAKGWSDFGRMVSRLDMRELGLPYLGLSVLNLTNRELPEGLALPLVCPETPGKG